VVPTFLIFNSKWPRLFVGNFVIRGPRISASSRSPLLFQLRW